MAEKEKLSLKETVLENFQLFLRMNYEEDELVEIFKTCLRYSDILDKLYLKRLENVGILCKLIENPKSLENLQEKCNELKINESYIEEITKTPIEISIKDMEVIVSDTECIFIDLSKGNILLYFVND